MKRYKMISIIAALVLMIGLGLIFSFGSTRSVIHQSAIPYEKYPDFDANLLKGITERKIERFAKKQIKERYGDRLLEWKIDGDSVVTQIDGKYYLEVGVISTVRSNVEGSEDITMQRADLYYYPLE